MGMIAKKIAKREMLVSKLSCAAGLPARRYSAINETETYEKKKAATQPIFPFKPVTNSKTKEIATAISKFRPF